MLLNIVQKTVITTQRALSQTVLLQGVLLGGSFLCTVTSRTVSLDARQPFCRGQPLIHAEATLVGLDDVDVYFRLTNYLLGF